MLSVLVGVSAPLFCSWRMEPQSELRCFLSSRNSGVGHYLTKNKTCFLSAGAEKYTEYQLPLNRSVDRMHLELDKII